MQLTKRLTEAEKNLQRARSEVFRLKLKIEEMVTNENAPSNASPIYAIPPTRVVENLKFVVEKKEVVSQPEKPLRERVVLQAQPDQNTILQSSSSVGEETEIYEEKDRSLMVIFTQKKLDSNYISRLVEQLAYGWFLCDVLSQQLNNDSFLLDDIVSRSWTFPSLVLLGLVTNQLSSLRNLLPSVKCGWIIKSM